MRKLVLPLSIVLLFLVASPRPVRCVTAGVTRQEVLIIVNQQSPASRRIGEYYRVARGIPTSNVCFINCPTTETTTITTYLQQIETPIKSFLTNNQLEDQIKLIVTTKGVPPRMAEVDRMASVDSALALLFNQSACGRAPVGEATMPFFGAVPNPYYGSGDAFANFRSASANVAIEAFPQIADLALLPNGNVVAVGDKGVIVRGSAGTWSVIDDQRKHYVQGNFGSVCFANSNEGWAATDDGKVVRTGNGGLDWTRIRASSNDRLNDIAAPTNSEIYVVGETVISSTETRPLILHYVSSWVSEPTGLTSGALYSVSAPDTGNVWACGSGGTILRRTGGVWERQTNGVPNTVYRSITMRNVAGNYHGWAAGDGGTILHTINGGDTWAQQPGGLTGRLSQVFALDSLNAWVTPDWQDSRLLKTTDGGGNWLSVQNDYNGKFAVAFSSNTDGYAVGADGNSGKFSVLHTSDGGVTWSPVFRGPDTLWRIKYLVCRLDAYSEDRNGDGLPDDVKALIDRAVSPEPSGAFVLDIDPGRDASPGSKLGNDQLRDARAALSSAGATTVLDEDLGAGSTFMTGEWLQQRFGAAVPVGGYCSWGSNDYGSRSTTQWARPALEWKPGAVAMCYVSTDGRTLNESDFFVSSSNSLVREGNWTDIDVVHANNVYVGWRAELRDTASGMTYSAIAAAGHVSVPFAGSVTSGYLEITVPDPDSPGSFIPLPGARVNASVSQPISGGNNYHLLVPQSLIADLLNEGCSGAIGNVYEPYLDGTGCPDKAFPKYYSGFTWAESAYAGLRYLGWQEVVIGDPLMAPNAPTVKIASPKRGGAVSGTISVTAAATDPRGVNRAELLLDGASRGVDTSPPYQWTINTTGVTDGRHGLEVAAYRDGPSGVTYRGYDYTEILVSNNAPIVNSPGDALSLQEGASVTIASGIITADSDALGGRSYVEHPVRFAALGLTPPAGISLNEGFAVSATGSMTTVEGERRLGASQMAIGEWVGCPAPIGFAEYLLGGKHSSPNVPALPGAHGVYNIGLLAKVIGRVTTVGSDYFYLDDGSALIDNSGNAGVRVECGTLVKPSTTHAAVTGIAGVETVNGGLARVIRVRKQEDIVPVAGF
ncbi:MAG: TIGR03790 family protein [Armatimonadota bacterium]|nr:TIGR03790 family protein [Armatimonadota bacterium]